MILFFEAVAEAFDGLDEATFFAEFAAQAGDRGVDGTAGPKKLNSPDGFIQKTAGQNPAAVG